MIADPIGHSLSPLIHNAAFAELKLNKVYVPFRVPREDLAQFIDDAPELGIKGLSVTIPHKEAVLPKLTKADGAVRGIGAVQHRRLRRQRAARLQHRLSRGDGRASKRRWAEPRTARTRWRGKTALVLGAGGVGKAIAYGLLRRGAHVVRRPTADRAAAEELAKRFELPHRRLGQAAHRSRADMLVNCTPVGMHPNVDETPFDKHHLRPSMVVFDAVYNPENTLLIKDARVANCTRRHRRRHVRPPGLPAVQALHRPGRPGRTDARRDPRPSPRQVLAGSRPCRQQTVIRQSDRQSVIP